MTIEIRRPQQENVPEVARILYEAFNDIATRHGFPPDFPSVEFCAGVVGLLLGNEQVYAAGAFDGSRPRGSNFMNMWGDVAGIGPISVDLDTQGAGIGRTLMQDALRRAGESGFEMVRLMQDAFNMQSLALYASLGFVTKEPVAYMVLSDAGPVDANFRPATAADYDGMDALCREIYHVSRRGEYAALQGAGFPIFVLDRGRIAGYLVGTALGHAVAEGDDDLLALWRGMGATVAGSTANCCLRQGELYRRALGEGHRNQKVMNLMAFGAYEEPVGTWAPSVMF